MGRDGKIYEEAAALWSSLYGEPPPRDADAHAMLDLLLKKMPAPEYGRLATPHLRSSNIAFPVNSDARRRG